METIRNTPAPIVMQDKSNNLYPIRTVSSLTGVNAITLRAWERRYGLIKPIRTAKGHRLYTQENIDMINKVVDLLAKGIPISQVSHTLAQRQEPVEAQISDTWRDYLNQMTSAIRIFDEDALEDIYNRVLALYPIDVVTNNLIVPLLIELGRRWETAEGSVAEEHFFSVYLRNKLGSRLHHGITNATGPRIVAACLPDENHEIGLLLFSLSALARGFRVILLGANMPIEELPLAVTRAKAAAIVLSGYAGHDLSTIQQAIEQLVKSVTVPVFIGGTISSINFDAFNRIGAIPLGDDIAHGVKRIIETVKTTD